MLWTFFCNLIKFLKERIGDGAASTDLPESIVVGLFVCLLDGFVHRMR